MTYTESENAAICMDVLVKAVGIVNAERFIAYMNRESGDYTVARRAIFDEMSPKELDKSLDEYKKNNPQILKAFENRIIDLEFPRYFISTFLNRSITSYFFKYT